jgi:aspartyl-tRNA(Asn)/glutamyl-tRNA(Gln) amidotransferase subunit B
MEHQVIVGLEIHVQLSTNTKMFCACAIEFAAPPNSRVCPVCMGMPGSLPVMNLQAFEKAVLAATALDCEIASFTKWDRKSYYYPDLPKNYQISQYDLPFSEHGHIDIPLADGETKKIRIRRVHLEEDAGKNTHAGGHSQVDLNRAGTPLLEIVTEPDMSSGAEVKALAMELQRIVRYLGVSHGDMQKGHMRFEPNINIAVQRDGGEQRTPIVEVKNLNSFRALEASVDYEAVRQLDELLETGKTIESGSKTTRGWDDDKQITVLQREKEEAHDYRYFPDPDLVPVEMDDEWLGQIQSRMCELPLMRQMRYVTKYGLSDYDAGVLTGERDLSDFFDAAVGEGANPKRICNLITQTGLKLANERECPFTDLGMSPQAVARLAKMVDSGEVNASAGARIMEEMAECEEDPPSIAQRLGLAQQSDAGQLEAVVDEVISENPKAVEDVRAGGNKCKKAKGFLLGQVMQKTKGSANPGVVSKILDEKLTLS